jgi:glycine betaine/choline ABC-type transport system substrate-binding protein
MQTFTLILETEVSTAVMRSLAKYLKSSGHQVPKEVTAGKSLTIQTSLDRKELDLSLQNYIGSATILEVQPN